MPGWIDNTFASQVAILTTAMTNSIMNLATLEASGPQAWVDYSIDGASYQFSQAKKQLGESIKTYQQNIQNLQPFYIVSGAR